MFQWDIYSGRHHEYMNGNLSKLMSSGDPWNGEDFSLVAQNSAGVFALRQDARVLDRVYPETLSGNLVAFTYEDLARDKGSVMSWNSVRSCSAGLAGTPTVATARASAAPPGPPLPGCPGRAGGGCRCAGWILPVVKSNSVRSPIRDSRATVRLRKTRGQRSAG